MPQYPTRKRFRRADLVRLTGRSLSWRETARAAGVVPPVRKIGIRSVSDVAAVHASTAERIANASAAKAA